MTSKHGVIALLWEGLHLAWGSRAFWAYRALVFGGVFLAGVAAIALAGLLGHLFGLIATVLISALIAGVVFVLAVNGVLNVTMLTTVEAEHALLLQELHRNRETPRMHGQIAWARLQADSADVPPVWLAHRIRSAMSVIHNGVQDVGEAFPAFAEGRAPKWARLLLACFKRPMAQALVGRAYAEGTGYAAYEAKTALLLYAAAWPEVFRVNLALSAIGLGFTGAFAGILAVFLALATAAGPFSVTASFVAVAFWAGFAVKRIVLDPVLEAAAAVAFEKALQGVSVASETEALLLEKSQAFRELDERARATSELEKGEMP